MKIKKEEIAGIGDSYNDIDMLSMFEQRFCMMSANDEVKKNTKTVGSVKEAVEIVLEMNCQEQSRKNLRIYE